MHYSALSFQIVFSVRLTTQVHARIFQSVRKSTHIYTYIYIYIQPVLYEKGAIGSLRRSRVAKHVGDREFAVNRGGVRSEHRRATTPSSRPSRRCNLLDCLDGSGARGSLFKLGFMCYLVLRALALFCLRKRRLVALGSKRCAKGPLGMQVVGGEIQSVCCASCLASKHDAYEPQRGEPIRVPAAAPHPGYNVDFFIIRNACSSTCAWPPIFTPPMP
jgi:hypothetical protein